MKEYRVSYELGDMLHTRIVKANNEYNAILTCMLKIPYTSQDKFKNLKVERYYEEWN